MDELQIYHSPIFGNIRIITKDGKCYGNGKDIATILAYRNHNDAIRRHCRKEGIIKHKIIDSMGRTQQANFLDKSNLHRLIAHSKLPAVKEFERWLFDEVLPSNQQEGPCVSMELLRQIKENRNLLKQLLQQMDTAPHQKDSAQVIREATLAKANFIAHSKLPAVQEFERWLFDEVLSSNQQEGPYVSMELLRQIKENRDLLKQLLQQMDTAPHQKDSTQVIREATLAKANFFDRCMDTAGLTNIRMTAKELNLSERKFISFLLLGGFLYRAPDGTLLPYTNEKNRPIFTVKEFRKNKHHGLQTYITAEGRALFAMLCLPDEGAENE